MAPAPSLRPCPLWLLCNSPISSQQAGPFRPACAGAVPLDGGACRSTIIHLHAAFGCRKGDTDGSQSLYRALARLPSGRADPGQPQASSAPHARASDRKSVGSGTRVSVRVDLGGRRTIKKKITTTDIYHNRSLF